MMPHLVRTWLFFGNIINAAEVLQGVSTKFTHVLSLLSSASISFFSDPGPQSPVAQRIRAVASISAGNDDFVGSMLADAIDKVGPDGVLSIDAKSNKVALFFYADAWMEATGGPQKGQLYGFGSTAKATSILGGLSASYSCTQPGSSFQPNCRQEQFEEMLNKWVEERLQAKTTEIKAQVEVLL